jgi:pyruvate dehydrogenase E1 component alpha subunit
MTPPAKRTTSRPASSSNGTHAANGSAKGASKSVAASSKLSTDELLDLHKRMYLIRRFEECVIEQFQAGTLPGFLHVAIGQEGIAVGVGAALRDDDWIGSTHRAHGHVLARGSSPEGMMAELMGKETGFCRGKGGSMHVSDLSHHVVGANGVVGAGAPMMVGVGLTQKLRNTGQVSVAFYGDGASNQGNVHEAMNLAQLWKLPVLFVLENNHYAESTPYWQQVPVKDLASRGAAFDMKTISVDGNDVLAVYDATIEAAAYARSGNGPVYMVCETRRIVGHYVGDAEVYRPKGESKEWKAGDPLPRFEQLLTSKHKVKQSTLDAQRASVDEHMEAVVEQALAAPAPAPEEAMLHVYAEDDYPGPVLGV